MSSQLSSQLAKEQAQRRESFIVQLHCLRYLLRQGLAVRGHTDVEGNLYQLLALLSTYISGLQK